MLTDLKPETMTDEEVIHYAELNDDPWVKRLLEVITNLEIEVSYNKQTLNDIEHEGDEA